MRLYIHSKTFYFNDWIATWVNHSSSSTRQKKWVFAQKAHSWPCNLERCFAEFNTYSGEKGNLIYNEPPYGTKNSTGIICLLSYIFDNLGRLMKPRKCMCCLPRVICPSHLKTPMTMKIEKTLTHLLLFLHFSKGSFSGMLQG